MVLYSEFYVGEIRGGSGWGEVWEVFKFLKVILI